MQFQDIITKNGAKGDLISKAAILRTKMACGKWVKIRDGFLYNSRQNCRNKYNKERLPYIIKI